MALFIEVKRVQESNPQSALYAIGEWEDGHDWPARVFSRIPGMTAAESVEYGMLELGYAASWSWGFNQFRDRLIGQFVRVDVSSVRGYKEVRDSSAHLVDL